MIPRAALAAIPSTETFGLPECDEGPRAQLANILKPKEQS
jgi:hypothetical protein